jgi:hypothetical protein
MVAHAKYFKGKATHDKSTFHWNLKKVSYAVWRNGLTGCLRFVMWLLIALTHIRAIKNRRPALG